MVETARASRRPTLWNSSRSFPISTGYSIDKAETGPSSLEEALEDNTPQEIALIKKERVGGYGIQFESPNLPVIYCHSVVYRSSEGAEEL